MYKYIKCYEQGYHEGIHNAYIDFFDNSIKYLRKIDDIELKSKLYDIGYIKGYIATIKSLSLNNW